MATAADAMWTVCALETVHSIAAQRDVQAIAVMLSAQARCRTLQGVEQRHSGVAETDWHGQTSWRFYTCRGPLANACTATPITRNAEQSMHRQSCCAECGKLVVR